MQNSRMYIVFLVSVFVLTACVATNIDPADEQTSVDENLLFTLPEDPISYYKTVKPVLERRCVSCHGCYDAPCQLKLSSIEGIQRGASKRQVYDGSRILGADPTRLMIDALTTDQWREKEFHPVINEGENTPRQNLEQSVLYKLLRMKQLHPQPRVGMLSTNHDLALNREQSCPKLEEFDDYKKEHPSWGMPYALPNLDHREYKTLVQWVAQGSPVEASPVASESSQNQVSQWEQFLNKRSSNKEALLSRYLYEHIFQAHIHFSDAPPSEFYRLVRSTTPSGEEIKEIATLRPYDDPGAAPFYYRLRPYNASIVAKSHVVYELSPEKMRRYEALFLEPDYQIKVLPSYDPALASNPFEVYKALPVNSRYRFLLDDARFFIAGFIKGPVCRGQIALNVIEDHFWTFFINPDFHIDTASAEFIDAFSHGLDIPSALGDTLNLLAASTKYRKKLEIYWKAKRDTMIAASAGGSIDEAMQSIWDGDGTNPNAALTIFRHFDSASVNFGLSGDYPETAWVIDYPLLERIHYLLVAGFNVYGNVGHQLNTRLYMDFLRTEGEDNYLTYLPASKRKAIHDSWYVGVRDGLAGEEKAGWLQKEVVVGYKTDDPQTELYQHLEARLGPMAGSIDHLNRCKVDGNSKTQSCMDLDQSANEKVADQAMKKVAGITGEILGAFPDLAYVRVRDEANQKNIAYTLIRNKSYKNISSIFSNGSDDQRDAKQDTLTVVRGLQGSYPNFFFDVDLRQIDIFADRYAAIAGRADYEKFVELFGVRRTHPDFWAISDWFQDHYNEQGPVLSGLFDLNRYNNR